MGEEKLVSSCLARRSDWEMTSWDGALGPQARGAGAGGTDPAGGLPGSRIAGRSWAEGH